MKKIVLVILILILPISVCAKEKVNLSKCIDGDTAKFKINNREYTVRFLAIDTPETKHPKKGVEPFGKEASNYTCDSLKKSERIELEYDDNSTKEDRYGRKLAWIFIDNELLQKKLIDKGYAKVAYLYGDYKYTNILKEAEKKAKKDKKGIWGEEIEDNSSFIDQILTKLFKYIRKEIKSMI